MEGGWRKNYVRYRGYFLNIAMHYKDRADIRAYFEILLSLATVALFALFALRPTLTTIAQLIKDINDKKQIVVVMTEKITKVSQAQSLYDQEKNNINLLDVALPAKIEADVFVRQMEGLAAKNGVSVATLTVGKATIVGTDPKVAASKSKSLEPLPKGLSSTNFSISLTGDTQSYPQFASFLNDITHLRRALKIDSFIIQTSAAGQESKKLLMNLEGRLPNYQGVVSESTDTETE